MKKVVKVSKDDFFDILEGNKNYLILPSSYENKKLAERDDDAIAITCDENKKERLVQYYYSTKKYDVVSNQIVVGLETLPLGEELQSFWWENKQQRLLSRAGLQIIVKDLNHRPETVIDTFWNLRVRNSDIGNTSIWLDPTEFENIMYGRQTFLNLPNTLTNRKIIKSSLPIAFMCKHGPVIAVQYRSITTNFCVNSTFLRLIVGIEPISVVDEFRNFSARGKKNQLLMSDSGIRLIKEKKEIVIYGMWK